MSFITIEQARLNKYKHAFVLHTAFGDQLLLMYSARLYFELTGQKLLLGTTRPDIFPNIFDYCDVISDLNVLSVGGKKFSDLAKNGIEIFSLYYHTELPKINNSENHAGIQSTHLIAQLLSQIGFAGKAILEPRFDLTLDEKHFGRFFEKDQIAVISRGKERYKTWGDDKVQIVVNALKNYNFVQIGAPTDPLLDGVLDKRGAFPIRKVAAILANSDLFIGGIGALMHLARGVNCRAVITYSLAEPMSVASYPCNSNITPAEACDRCQFEKINAAKDIEQCSDNFSCIRKISPEAVIFAVDNLMKNKKFTFESEQIIVFPNPPKPLTFLTARLASIYAKKSDAISQMQLTNNI